MSATIAAGTSSGTNGSSMVERFVPVGEASLIDDAPGWSSGIASNDSPKSQQREQQQQEQQGPVCWKCRGLGQCSKRKPKKKRQRTKAPPQESTPETTTAPTIALHVAVAECTVCQGQGHLPPKQQAVKALHHRPGEITRPRVCPFGWKPRGPVPWALRPHNSTTSNNQQQQAIRLVQLAGTLQQEVPVIILEEEEEEEGHVDHSSDPNTGMYDGSKNTTPITTICFSKNHNDSVPSWLPQRGEQLCNLVGQWRILQRVASHRWTTDDLVTSYMAGRVFGHQQPNTTKSNSLCSSSNLPIKYLDLGCGNGSVLLMTTWQLLKQQQEQQQSKQREKAKETPTNSNSTTINFTATPPPLTSVGIEARSEAVALARRSISFNLGDTNNQNDDNKQSGVDIQVHHGDFRSTMNDMPHLKEAFDLVTGTPPYFRVDFVVETERTETATSTTAAADTTNVDNTMPQPTTSVVKQAVIRQGGMPTGKSSAPARCEFRGGVEAYCQAAAMAMHTSSVFCVCENWLNNDRVYQGAALAGLIVVQVLPVKGRTGKPCPLFAVYVMRKRTYFEKQQQAAGIPVPTTKVLDCLTVRDEDGNWTEDYEEVLDAMSIPV